MKPSKNRRVPQIKCLVWTVSMIIILLLLHRKYIQLFPTSSNHTSAITLQLYSPVSRKQCTDFNPQMFQYDSKSTCLIQYIRHVIVPPSLLPLNLKNPSKKYFSQVGQDNLIDKLLKERRNGFYIECGGYVGEDLSNTLFFERERGWDGVLIEANPKLFEISKSKHRRAYLLEGCLSMTDRSTLMKFTAPVAKEYLGGLAEAFNGGFDLNNMKNFVTNVICFPLLSVLRALNKTHVDYFSLDVEGAELAILKTFPWQEIQVDVLSVEYRVIANKKATMDTFNKLKSLLVDTGLYNLTAILPKGAPNSLGLDMIFMRRPPNELKGEK